MQTVTSVLLLIAMASFPVGGLMVIWGLYPDIGMQLILSSLFLTPLAVLLGAAVGAFGDSGKDSNDP